jgi:hypothetical protein
VDSTPNAPELPADLTDDELALVGLDTRTSWDEPEPPIAIEARAAWRGRRDMRAALARASQYPEVDRQATHFSDGTPLPDPREDPAFEPEPDDRSAGDFATTEGPTDDDPNTDSAGHTDRAHRPPSQAAELVEHAQAAKLFHDAAGVPYATFDVSGHRETWPLRSGGFRSWVTHQYWLRNRRAVSSQARQDAIAVLEAHALFEGPELRVALRVAEANGRLYLDLGDPEWRAVEITATGWTVVSDSPVRFRRPKGMLALPEPVRGGRLDELRHLLNVGDDDAWRLLLAFMVGALRPRGPYWVLVLAGEQGSAKTTTSREIRALLDPATSPDRARPRDDRDLVIAASNGHLIAYDNLSSLQEWQSDGLARLATGAGFGTRQLYTDADETLFFASKPIILNGVGELAERPDLLDRALLVTLPRIPDECRRPDEELWAAFEEARPRILGALLDATSAALAGYKKVQLRRLPRMADLARWVTAAEPALGWQPGAFMETYRENRASAHELAISAALIAAPVRAVAEAGGFTGTPSDLLVALSLRVDEATTKRRDWPSNPKVLSDQLRRLAPNLRALGVGVRFGRGHNRRIEITLLETKTSDASDASDALSTLDRVAGDATDALIDASDAPSDAPEAFDRVGGVAGDAGVAGFPDRPPEPNRIQQQINEIQQLFGETPRAGYDEENDGRPSRPNGGNVEMTEELWTAVLSQPADGVEEDYPDSASIAELPE